MMRRTLARSLPVVLGLALALPLAVSAASPGVRSGENASGAVDLLVAYENTLMAHADASVGDQALAQGHLNVARLHLETASRLLGTEVAAPMSERSRGGGGGPDQVREREQQRERGATEERERAEGMRGGGGGPAKGPLGGLETMMRATEEEINVESTNRLVAAFTNELSRISRMGGGGGPGIKPQTLADRITATEHLEMAYAAAGKAAGSTAIQAWDEARASVEHARRHIDEAKRAPGNEAVKAQLEVSEKALKDAEGPIKGRSNEALDRSARAVREMSVSIATLGQQSR